MHGHHAPVAVAMIHQIVVLAQKMSYMNVLNELQSWQRSTILSTDILLPLVWYIQHVISLRGRFYWYIGVINCLHSSVHANISSAYSIMLCCHDTSPMLVWCHSGDQKSRMYWYISYTSDSWVLEYRSGPSDAELLIYHIIHPGSDGPCWYITHTDHMIWFTWCINHGHKWCFFVIHSLWSIPVFTDILLVPVSTPLSDISYYSSWQ